MFLSHEGSLSFKVSAPLSDLIELAQQIVWICSALRVGQTNNTSHAYRRDVYHPIYEVSESYMKGNATFHVSCQSESTTWKQDSCWREVVAPTAVLCQHFPIPQRRDEVGLEIPLGMFCAMAGMRHAVEFEGGIVMKSVDGMLIPVSRKDNIVQWHFVSGDDDGERFKYQHGISKCPNRALIDTVDFETLETTRAIVGWCRRARKVVGREIAAYHGIDYSGTKAFSSGIRYSGTSFGFQQFGTAQLNFTMGPKDTRVVFQRSGTFTKILRWAGESHVLLQDTVDKRAWLVNADGVILHVIQTRSYRDQTHNQETNESLDHLEYANTASETLANHENWKFPTSSDTVSDMVFEIWSKLEMLLDQATALNKTPDRRVRIPFQKELVGFEFMGIVKEKSPLDIKRYTLENDSGGWARLIKDTATLVLFAQGFRDLIEPESCNQEDCSAWQKMPKGRDYLGTTVPILMDFYAMAGSSSDLKRLTSSGLYWCSQNTAFDNCREPQSHDCPCNKLQDISTSESHAMKKEGIEPHGGVIFGRPSSYSVSEHVSGGVTGWKAKSAKSWKADISSIFTHTNALLPSPTSGLAKAQALSNLSGACPTGNGREGNSSCGNTPHREG